MQRIFPRIFNLLIALSFLWPSLPSAPAIASINTSVFLDQQLRESFPVLAPQLEATAQFRPALQKIDGRTVVGVQAQSAPNFPTNLKPQEQQTWLAMAERQADTLQTFFPNRFGDAFVVEGGNTKVTLQALHANTSAPIEIQAGKVVYKNAYRQTDSLHVVKSGASEEFLYLKQKSAPHQFDYALHVQKDVTVKLVSGKVAFIRGGKTALAIAAPYVVDGRGKKLTQPVHWELVGGQAKGTQHLRLVLNAKEVSYPLTIDPAWSTTGSISVARSFHTATLLGNGKVLVVGGTSNGTSPLSSAELYDPATGIWSVTGSMATPRYLHTAALLTNGKVLVVGGISTNTTVSSAELYDPSTGAWTATGTMSTTRAYHTATKLANGNVLIVGGFNSTYLSSAELYSATSGTWSAAGAMSTARQGPTATLLSNGNILVVGGFFVNSLSSADVYNSQTGGWSVTGSMSTARQSHTATLLSNGNVLVAGGFSTSVLSSAEIYNAATGSWSLTGSMATPRQFHTATLLSNGSVLVVGGLFSNTSTLNSAELYSSTTSTWTTTASLATPRYTHTATLLSSGKVLAAGGFDGTKYLNSVELFDLAAASTSFRFFPLAPCRIVDTRQTATPTLTASTATSFVVNSVGLTGSYSAQGGSASGCNLPTNAKAVFFNFVAVNATGSGFFQAWPFGSPIPTASVLNYANVQNLNLANGIVLPVCDPATATCTKDLNVQANQADIQLVVDVVGYFK
jgi:Galactose oxidase, central domain/Kelch motif